jgi:N-methylhydantoinase A/oxoprolinase/acetone carboxylase beta subunit
MNEIRIGVDTGGTFTDFVIFKDGKLSIKKIPSTPSNPSLAIIEGLEEFLGCRSGLTIIHGTTVATNALLERKGARIALITTKGFEDVLYIGRQTRRELYSLKGERRNPIVEPRLCFGLEERTTAAGTVEQSVKHEELGRILKKIKALGIQTVAVSLLNSYANPANEQKIHKALKKGRFLSSISSEILPEYREYERTSTAAVNACLMPILHKYLSSLEEKIHGAELHIMQSNEGYLPASKAKLQPIRTALSGPAGGVVGSLYLAKAAGFPKIISFDMGGTSTDVSLIEGRIRRTGENMIGDFPVRIPIIDIHSVGAGGGSIAHFDKGGSLRVGPQSAGADPGPACYGRGDLPTVTDANLVLGRIDPDFFLGGKMAIYPARSFKAVKRLASKIRKSTLETAQGIVDIANVNMEKAVRLISIERGFDPRDFALFSFGGAGGLHAADMMTHLQMKSVVVPENAGVLSAFGLLLADSVKDYTKTVLKPADKIRPQELENLFTGLERKGFKDLIEDGFAPSDIVLERYADFRYLGQSYEITLPFRKGGRRFLENFHREHQKLYSYHNPQGLVEIVTLRVKARGLSQKIKIRKQAQRKADPAAAFLKKQTIYHAGKKFQAPVYDRSRLSVGARLKGPALVMDFGSTTFLPPGFHLRLDGYHNLILHKDSV